MELLQQVEVIATQLGASPWLLLLVFGLTVLDGLFPPVPSETVLITAAVLAVGAAWPNVLAVVVVGASGAFLGDFLAYSLGRCVPVHRLPGRRGEKGARMMARAASALDRRGTTIIVTGRFIPVGRVAINVSAGVLGFARGRFVLAAGVAALLWAGYSALIGVGAQALLGGSALLSAALGTLVGILTGLAVEAVLRRLPGPVTRAADDLAALAMPDGRDPVERIPMSTAGRWLT